MLQAQHLRCESMRPCSPFRTPPHTPAGSFRLAAGDSSPDLGLDGGDSGAVAAGDAAAAAAEEGAEAPGHFPSQAITQRRRPGETEMASVGVE